MITSSKVLDPKKKTLLFFHSNATTLNDISRFINKIISDCNYNVIAIDYRGYGNSTGEPSEKGLYLDTDATIQELLKMLSKRRI